MCCKNCWIYFSGFILLISIYMVIIHEFSYEEIEIDNSKAKCLDGSNYKFLFSKGFGDGINSYYIFFEPGGFCGDNNYNPKDEEGPLKSCIDRKNTKLGNNKFSLKIRYFHSYLFKLFSLKKFFNPKFYNWNKIFIKYCDGTLHIGNKKEPIIYKNNKFYVRGEENVKSVFNFLIEKHNFSNAKDVLAMGASAGGIAVLFYSKYIKSLLPKDVNFNVISDSGYFEQGVFNGMDRMKGMMELLQKSLKLEQTKTMKNIAPNLDFVGSSYPKTYINLLNNDYKILFFTSLYDAWALKRLIKSRCFFSRQVYDNCTKTELSHFEEYAKSVEKSFDEIIQKDKTNKITAFMPKGFFHMLAFTSWTWNDKSYGVENYSVEQFLYDWYDDKLPKGKKIFKDSKNILKNKIDMYWIINRLSPD